MRRRGLTGIALAIACGLPSLAIARPDPKDWRIAAPKPGPEPAAPTPLIERADLPNGLAVIVHQRHDVPFVVVEAVVSAGDAAEPPGKEGLAALTAEMLQAGTDRHDAGQLADAVATLGAELTSESAPDATHVELGTLKATLPRAVELLGEVVVRSTFPAAELERARTRRRSQIIERADDPAESVRDVMPAVAYGEGHPYAAPHFGTAESVARLTRDDLLGFYQARYRPGGAAVIFVGDVTLAEARALVESSAFAKWPKAQVAPIDPTAPVSAPPRGIVLVDKAGAPQSQVGFVMLTVPARHPDRVAIEVIEACLGGTFSSRLNINLREEHGYTYGAYTRIHWRRGPSLFDGRGGIRTDVTVPSVGEFRNELRKMVAEPPSDAEIALAKAQLIHGVTGAFETMREAAAAIEELFVTGLPLDYYRRFSDEVGAISRAQIIQAIAAHFHPDRATIVIVGDRARIEPELTVQHRDAVGRPLR